VERAFTLPSSRVQARVVASSAAHRLAVRRHRRCRRRRRPVAASAARSQRPDGRVEVAVARRRVQVDEATPHRFLIFVHRSTRRSPPTSTQSQEDGRHGSPAADRLDAASSPVAGRQTVADGAEARQSDPARLHRARSRHAVAHALRRYRVTQRLRRITTLTRRLILYVVAHRGGSFTPDPARHGASRRHKMPCGAAWHRDAPSRAMQYRILCELKCSNVSIQISALMGGFCFIHRKNYVNFTKFCVTVQLRSRKGTDNRVKNVTALQ